MQAQRKLADPALTQALVDAPMERGADADFRPPAADGDRAMSPALALQAQLAARLAQVEAIAAEPHDALDAPEPKLPMALRVATIMGLSALLWGGFGVAAVTVLT